MVKIQIINGNERQIVIDTKGKNNPKDIYVIGIRDSVVLDIDEKLIKKIYDSLNENGLFLMSEKLITEHKKLNKIMIDIYYEYKKNKGYSEYEIAQKREALENVLIPYTMQENIEMLKNAGFNDIEVIFRWNNFATFIAFK